MVVGVVLILSVLSAVGWLLYRLRSSYQPLDTSAELVVGKLDWDSAAEQEGGREAWEGG